MKFVGIRSMGTQIPLVYFREQLLDPEPSQAVRLHSPCGFEWGYQGSGPAQLALAMLLEMGGIYLAQIHYQDFKRDVVSAFPKEGWRLPADAVLAWLCSRHVRWVDAGGVVGERF